MLSIYKYVRFTYKYEWDRLDILSISFKAPEIMSATYEEIPFYCRPSLIV